MGLVAYLLLSDGIRPRLIVAAVPLVAVVAVVFTDAIIRPEGVSRHWSPYYEIEVEPIRRGTEQVGYDIIVNKDSHQQALDLSDRYAGDPLIASRQHLYELPYALIQPRRVLVVGAGTGNDVAAALRAAPGATVDAVEIDPVIARLGRELHPERPYDNPNVRVHIDDARSFLQKSDEEYDLIVFGFLDSHRLFSQMSSVRMDNYVYTRENFESVRDHLAPGGVVAVTFTVHEKWIADRIFTVMKHVFGRAPLVYQGNANAWGTTFLAGDDALPRPPGAAAIDRPTFDAQLLGRGERRTWQYTGVEGFIDPAVFSAREVLLTDEWPYLYMRSRSVPDNYLIVLILTVLVSLAAVWRMVPRIDFRRPSNWNFFLLGAAFALLETPGITELALVFGSTWITNSIVISAILLMILLANLLVVRSSGLPLRWSTPRSPRRCCSTTSSPCGRCWSSGSGHRSLSPACRWPDRSSFQESSSRAGSSARREHQLGTGSESDGRGGGRALGVRVARGRAARALPRRPLFYALSFVFTFGGVSGRFAERLREAPA